MAQSPFNVSPPPPLKLKDNKSEEWKLFRQLWDNYVVITELQKKDKKYQRAVFLNVIGPEGLRLFNTLKFSTLEDGTKEDEYDITLIVHKMDTIIVGEVNETYERYVFNRREQGPQETIDEYVTTLRDLARTCNFCECLQDSLIRDRLVLGIKDPPTRKTLLQKKNLTLETAIGICRSAEATSHHLRDIGEDPTCAVHAVKPRISRQGQKFAKPPGKGGSTTSSKSHKEHRQRDKDKLIKCKFCAKTHKMSRDVCAAYGKLCSVCHKMNHFAVCCPTKQRHVKTVQEHETTSDETDVESVEVVEAVNSASHKKKGIFTEMLIDQTPVKFQIDSGATVNVIPKKYIQTAIQPERMELKMYNNTSLWGIGSAMVKLRNPKTRKKYLTKFVVIEEDCFTPILCRKTAEWMKLITVNYENFNLLHSINNTKDPVILEFQDVFDDSAPGKLPGIVSLEVEPDAHPVQCGAKPIPVSLKERVKQELADMVSKDIIAPVDKPTDWCSRLVITEKKNTEDLRFCIDPRPLNKVLKRELHRLPVIEDILPELSKAKVFSKLDLKSGYLHCVLDDKSLCHNS